MKEQDKQYTTFTTHRGLFQFNVMSFGLIKAPATFSRIMRKLLDKADCFLNYLDDVLAPTRGSYICQYDVICLIECVKVI